MRKTTPIMSVDYLNKTLVEAIEGIKTGEWQSKEANAVKGLCQTACHIAKVQLDTSKHTKKKPKKFMFG